MGSLIREDTVLTVQGTEIPRLGYGTWQVTGRDATDGVRDALEIGYRHIDTARAYGNEAEVGEGIAAAGVDRGELFSAERLGEFIERQAANGMPAPETLRGLRQAIIESGEGSLRDDATALLVEWRRGSEQALLPQTV